MAFSPEQKALLELLRGARCGRENAITGVNLRQYILSVAKVEVTEPGLRDLVRGLRLSGQPICSASGVGYWWPARQQEIFDTAKNEFHDRAMALLAVEKALKLAAIELFGPQLGLL